MNDILSGAKMAHLRQEAGLLSGQRHTMHLRISRGDKIDFAVGTLFSWCGHNNSSSISCPLKLGKKRKKQAEQKKATLFVAVRERRPSSQPVSPGTVPGPV